MQNDKKYELSENQQPQKVKLLYTLEISELTEDLLEDFEEKVDNQKIPYKGISGEGIELLITSGYLSETTTAFLIHPLIQDDKTEKLTPAIKSEFIQLVSCLDFQIGEFIKNSIDAAVARSLYFEYQHPIIYILLEKTQDHYTIRISDNGTGIPTEYLEKFNNPNHFDSKDINESTKTTRKGQCGGAAQGLKQSKEKVIQELKGTISAQNFGNFGDGAYLTITIPKTSLSKSFVPNEEDSIPAQPRRANKLMATIKENNRNPYKEKIVFDSDYELSDDEDESKEDLVSSEADDQTTEETQNVINKDSNFGTSNNFYKAQSPRNNITINTYSASDQTSSSSPIFGD